MTRRFANSKKIMLGAEFSAAEVFSFLVEGVHGFVLYKSAQRQLVYAIEAVAQGRLWIEKGKLEQACLHMQGVWSSKRGGHFKFTHRQKQIIDLLKLNYSNKEIASRLSISENTVKFHLAKIFEKIGTHSRYSVPEFLKLTDS